MVKLPERRARNAIKRAGMPIKHAGMLVKRAGMSIKCAAPAGTKREDYVELASRKPMPQTVSMKSRCSWSASRSFLRRLLI